MTFLLDHPDVRRAIYVSPELTPDVEDFLTKYGKDYLLKAPSTGPAGQQKNFKKVWAQYRAKHPVLQGDGLDFDEHEHEHERHERHEHEPKQEKYFPERELGRIFELVDHGQSDVARTYAMSLRNVLSAAQITEVMKYICHA